MFFLFEISDVENIFYEKLIIVIKYQCFLSSTTKNTDILMVVGTGGGQLPPPPNIWPTKKLRV